MYNTDFTFIHPDFTLNSISLNREGLLRLAYNYIKEGEIFEQHIGAFLEDWLDTKDFIVMHTSGTTGKPKEIKVQKQAMVQSALATGAFFDLPAGTTALLCLPAQYIAGKMMLVRAMLLGWRLDIVEPSSIPLENIEYQYDFSAMVPLQAQESLKDLYKIKQLILGGAKVSKALADILQESASVIYETYGMTETVSHIAVKRVGDNTFTMLPGVEIHTDERNCLVINAPKLYPEPLKTNDVVEIVDDRHFMWLGRFDNVINSGGVKLFPEQIEEKLSGLIERRFFVAPLPDEKLGNKLVLVVEGVPYDVPESIFSVLEKYEKPKEIIFKEQFAETSSGKIIRHKNL